MFSIPLLEGTQSRRRMAWLVGCRRRTEKPGAVLQFFFFLLPELSLSAGCLVMFAQPVCAFACITIWMHISNPLKDKAKVGGDF